MHREIRTFTPCKDCGAKWYPLRKESSVFVMDHHEGCSAADRIKDNRCTICGKYEIVAHDGDDHYCKQHAALYLPGEDTE